jgi:hypothetical protein
MVRRAGERMLTPLLPCGCGVYHRPARGARPLEGVGEARLWGGAAVRSLGVYHVYHPYHAHQAHHAHHQPTSPTEGGGGGSAI